MGPIVPERDSKPISHNLPLDIAPHCVSLNSGLVINGTKIPFQHHLSYSLLSQTLNHFVANVLSLPNTSWNTDGNKIKLWSSGDFEEWHFQWKTI